MKIWRGSKHLQRSKQKHTYSQGGREAKEGQTDQKQARQQTDTPHTEKFSNSCKSINAVKCEA